MKLQILGTGCAKCNALTAAAEQAAQSLGLQYELEKVTDLKQIMSFGVMTTPALVVDGQVKVPAKCRRLNKSKRCSPEIKKLNYENIHQNPHRSCCCGRSSSRYRSEDQQTSGELSAEF